MTPLQPPLDFLNALDRYNFLKLLKAARETGEFQFIKQACMLWLVNYPGDLYVKFLQGQNLKTLDKHEQAKSIFEHLILKDPLFIEPVDAMSRSSYTKSPAYYHDLIQYLTQEQPQNLKTDGWLAPLWQARNAFNNGNYANAIQHLHLSLVHNPPTALPAILHLKSAYKMKNQELLSNLSEIYLQKWPNCLQINIIKAITDLDMRKEAQGVERLHWAAANDSTGQVINRLMGTSHRFKSLWPQSLEIYFDLPIPAAVNAKMGWNQLQSRTTSQPSLKQKHNQNSSTRSDNSNTGYTASSTAGQPTANALNTSVPQQNPKQRPSSKHNQPERWATDRDFEDIQKAFTRLAKRLKKPDLSRTDNRFPIYTLLCSKKQLENCYGPNTAAIIDDLLKKLVNLVRQLPEWGALLFYPDDPSQMSHLGLKPVVANDAWNLKLSLAELDQALAHQGEMIGALLIIGGPEIIPFHQLPNPTSDNDHDVPSDNPYATIDDNYFIPQWPVGRLPGESGPDAGHLLAQIRRIIYQYEQKRKRSLPQGFNLNFLLNWILQLFTNIGISVEKQSSLGYSAEIWQESSAAVYAILGKARNLYLSPPNTAANIPINATANNYLGYFNLHGIQDGPNWYGQKDYSSNANGPDYPIALTPGRFNQQSPAPELIFTEACYGANIINKSQSASIALKSLDTGSDAFIGSTCIAYGSVTQPLIAADFLAKIFWQQILQGDSAGYALMRAKLSLAQAMTQMQGFLDGEDQKTLLSFVLYGDPLAVFEGYQAAPKPVFRFKSHPKVKTLNDSDLLRAETPVPRKVEANVKRIVARYLPGLQHAEIQLKTAAGIDKSGRGSNQTSKRYLVTLEKSINLENQQLHQHFARMTFDQKGNLVKLTTSR